MNDTRAPKKADWLRERGNGADRELDDLVFMIDVPLTFRMNPLGAAAVLLGALVFRSEFRQARSRDGQIGAYLADVDWLTGSVAVTRPLAWRGVAALAAVGGAVVVGFPWWATMLLGIACFVIAGGAVTTLVALAIGVALLVTYTHGWAWTILSMYLAAMAVMARKPSVALGGGAMGPGLGFVPWTAVVRMMLNGSWSSFSIGVDKAHSDDALRAEPFLARAERRAGAYRPVIGHARALIRARLGDTTGALDLVAQAQDGMTALPATTQGWAKVVVSDILAAAGQAGEARPTLESAVPLLKTSGRARGTLFAAQLRLVDAAIAQDEYDLAVQILADVRWRALRHRNLDLVATTEGYLVQMMLALGNRDGALWTVAQFSPRDAARVRPSETSSRTALWSVLHARVALEDGQLDEAEHQAQMAVSRADLATDLAPRAVAHLVLAEVRCAMGRAADALPDVLTALNVLQQVRYGLPASDWRRNWVALNARAYELGLEVASATDDPCLVAELIETIRAQAVPVGLERTTSSLDQIVSVLMDAASGTTAVRPYQEDVPGSRAGSAALALLGVDPVRPPSAIYVDGASWVGMSSDSATDLDALVTAIAGPAGWYWSGCLAAGQYWWALRTPAGSWLWGSVPMGAESSGRSVLTDMMDALPFERPGESDAEFHARWTASPLYQTARDPRERLMEKVSRTFLPEPLRDALEHSSQTGVVPVLAGLSGLLSALPVNALPVSSTQQVIDVATVSHVPSPALLDETSKTWPEPDEHTSGITVVVVDPRTSMAPLPNAKAPKGASIVLEGEVTKADVETALRSADPRGVFCAFAHYCQQTDVPAAGGLLLTDDVLTLRDLVSWNSSENVRVPERVLLAMCESIAAGAGDAVATGPDFGLGAGTWEWLGLSAGFFAAGARYVVATSWPLLDHPRTTDFDHAIADALTKSSPSSAVREAILGLVPPEKRDVVPVMLWSAYSFLGPLESQTPRMVLQQSAEQ